MRIVPATLTLACLLALAGAAPMARSATDELDALKLEAEPAKADKALARPLRMFAEAAAGSADQRYGLGTQSLQRMSLDLQYGARLSADWRIVFSDRLDIVHPKPANTDAAVNTLREAYVSWQEEAGQRAAEFGRISLRNGPGYGYNPTDFFRAGSQRAVTTVDPIALRDNRMGTVAARVQGTWTGGSLALALAPKLSSKPSNDGFNPDLGATNDRHRAQLVWSQKLGEGVSGQLLMFKQDGQSLALGASATALLGEAVVAHAEWSTSREPTLIDRVNGSAAVPTIRADRAVVGMTFSAPAATTVTAEYQYNGFALGGREWAAVAAGGGVPQLGAYLLKADERLDLAARRALLIYATKKNLGVKNLDLTALVRLNVDDDSYLAWVELRYQWAQAELALQWLQLQGNTLTEFGTVPTRRSVQLVGTYRF